MGRGTQALQHPQQRRRLRRGRRGGRDGGCRDPGGGTGAPADSEFTSDDWVDDSCQFVGLPLGFGEPSSAFGEWYDYDVATHILSPKLQVYVVRTRSGSLVKLQIETYYGDDAGLESALYRVVWAPL